MSTTDRQRYQCREVFVFGCVGTVDVKAGKHDARSTTFTDAKHAGVKLDIPRSESTHARSGRHDTAYVMTRLHTFMKGNPSAASQQRRAERSRLLAEWASLGPEQQGAFAETRGGDSWC